MGSILFGAAEACSYRSAIRTAKGVVEDLGEAVAASSGGLTHLSRCSEAHSERDGRTVIAKKFGLALPIEFSPLQKAPSVNYSGELCMLKLKSWLNFIVSMNCMHLLCGLHNADPKREKSILESFWKKYRAWKPEHSMWRLVDSGSLDVTRCYPLVLHGDEGRGRKRSPFLIISWSSILGFGTELANGRRKRLPYNAMKLNYTGSTHLTRFISAALPKMAHDHEALIDILRQVAEDANHMLQEGVCDSEGFRHYAVCVHAVGDWAWLVKAGSFTRGYGNVNKRPWTAKSTPKGICHLCRAGQFGVPWENYRVYTDVIFPAWYPTFFLETPWETPSPLNNIPYISGEEPGFYAFDLFHSYHLGVGKTFAAACLALASEFMVSGNLDGRLEELTNLYLTWASENHEKTFMLAITKANLGWMSQSEYPNGQWSKGHVTTTLVKFFISWAQREDLNGNELLQLSFEASLEISKCLDLLYGSDVWIPKSDAVKVAQSGMKFLDLYRRLSVKSFQTGRALFSHMPKGHCMDHIFFDVHKASLSKRYILNPLVCSVQIFEDYIGRCSRLARRTSPQQVVKRVLERALQASYKHWYEGGYIKD